MIKILMTHLQLVGMMHSFDLKWPGFVRSMFNAFDTSSSVDGNLMAIDCMVTNLMPSELQVPSVYVWSTALLCAPLALLAGSALVWQCVRRCNRESDQKTHFKATAVILLNMLYTTLTRQSFALFACRSISSFPGRRFLISDLDEECYSGRHRLWALLLGVPGIVCYAVGVPATAAILLRRKRAHLRTEHVKATWGFLYNGYLEQYVRNASSEWH